MANIDWIILWATLLFIVIYGSWKSKKNSTIQEYIKGSSQAKWWTVGLSVMATQASAITFLSTPGQAFNDGMGFVQFYFGLPFAVIIICLFFLPIYHKLNVYTAYEYLEKRFDKKVRTLTALLFLIQRGLAAGITIYAPAIILSVVLGWNLKLLILIVGLLVIFYTVIGGTKAVNVTQKQQMVVIFLGLFLAFFFILDGFPKEINFIDALKIAGKSNKLNVLDFTFNLENRYTFWTGILGGTFLSLSYFGTDQSQVQRYLSGKSLNESRKGLLMNGFLKIPMQFFILLVGVMIFIFYQFQIAPLHFNPKAIESIENSKYAQSFNELKLENKNLQKQKKEILLSPTFLENQQLQKQYQDLLEKDKAQRTLVKKYIPKNSKVEKNDKDYIFIYYVLNQLPKGIIGLLIAVILLAAMSSTSAELNALASTSLIDLYKRNRQKKSELHYVKFSKFFTLIWGLIAILFANIVTLFENLIQLVNIIGSLFYGTILGIFLIGFFIKIIKSKTIFWAAIISELIVISCYLSTKFLTKNEIGFLWLNVLGIVAVILISFLIHSFKKLKLLK